MAEEEIYTWNEVDYYPESGMTFREIDQYVKDHFFADLQGYEGCLVDVFYGSKGDYDFRVNTSSGEPDKFLQSLLSKCQMNCWLKCYINQKTLEKHQGKESAATVQNLINEIYDLSFDNHNHLEELCLLLTHSYSDFLVDIAKDVFEG